MLEEVLQYLRNWFCRTVIAGDIIIENGRLATINGESAEGLFLTSQYFRILGSRLNDGIYQAQTDELHDETFNGAVWGLAIPHAVIALVRDIETWQEKYGADAASPYTSVSFVNYSQSKAAGANGDTSWQTVFYSRLAPWRKI